VGENRYFADTDTKVFKSMKLNMQKRKKPPYNNKKGVIRIKEYKDTTHDTN
jgi:hypothetical protein